jgi:hypothetical protein
MTRSATSSWQCSIALIVLTAIFAIEQWFCAAHAFAPSGATDLLWSFQFRLILTWWVFIDRPARGFRAPFEFDASCFSLGLSCFHITYTAPVVAGGDSYRGHFRSGCDPVCDSSNCPHHSKWILTPCCIDLVLLQTRLQRHCQTHRQRLAHRLDMLRGAK